jgi:hypothetical protein
MKNYILAALDYILNWILPWGFTVYDRLFSIPYALPYFWVKVGLGIATGLFIPRRIIGLVACALGNVAIFAYAAFGHWNPDSATSLIKLLKLAAEDPPFGFFIVSSLVFAGVVWWVAGRIMRWAFYKIARVEVKSTPTAP